MIGSDITYKYNKLKQVNDLNFYTTNYYVCTFMQYIYIYIININYL